MENYFSKKGISHIIDTKQFKDKRILDDIFSCADKMKEHIKKGKILDYCKGKIMCSLFYEPSTRTKMTFDSAMKKLGGEVIGTENAREFSSAVKGESLEDSVRAISDCFDIIIIRHSETGAAERAASVSPVPVINAGDGNNQHPTQAITDLYTINNELDRIDNITIGLLGDLKNGRTVRSLTYLLAHQKNIKFFFISPLQLKMKDDIKSYLAEKGIGFVETNNLKSVVAQLDILYVTRIQEERFNNTEDYNSIVKNYADFIVVKETLDMMKENSRIMHPLPRDSRKTPEISIDVDKDERAAYFRQSNNGLYVRMALLKMLSCK